MENGRIVSVELHLLSDEELEELKEKRKAAEEEERERAEEEEGSLLSRLIRPRIDSEDSPDRNGDGENREGGEDA